MQDPLIGFIGGGNMATAIVRGLLARGTDATRLAVSDPSPERRDALATLLAGGLLTEDNVRVADAADVLVLAIKPQLMSEALPPLRDVVQRRRPLVVSVAAGVRSHDIDSRLGGGLAVVRCMPNQPALIGEGMTVLYANAAAESAVANADAVLAATGPTLWVEDESMIDAATAISGSGPAYLYFVMEILAQAAEEFGFAAEDARRLVSQTATGAAATVASEPAEIAALRAAVTSPGGTTAAALGVLEEAGVRDIFSRAVKAARTRAAALADSAGDD